MFQWHISSCQLYITETCSIKVTYSRKLSVSETRCYSRILTVCYKGRVSSSISKRRKTLHSSGPDITGQTVTVGWKINNLWRQRCQEWSKLIQWHHRPMQLYTHNNNNNLRICIPPQGHNFRGGICHSLERAQADPLYLSEKLIS